MSFQPVASMKPRKFRTAWGVVFVCFAGPWCRSTRERLLQHIRLIFFALCAPVSARRSRATSGRIRCCCRRPAARRICPSRRMKPTSSVLSGREEIGIGELGGFITQPGEIRRNWISALVTIKFEPQRTGRRRLRKTHPPAKRSAGCQRRTLQKGPSIHGRHSTTAGRPLQPERASLITGDGLEGRDWTTRVRRRR